MVIVSCSTRQIGSPLEKLGRLPIPPPSGLLVAAKRASAPDNIAAGRAESDIAERLALSDDRSLRRFCVAHFKMPPAKLRVASEQGITGSA